MASNLAARSPADSFASPVGAAAAAPVVAGLSWRQMVSWTTKGSLAIADQGLFAGSNFLLNVLLARWLDPADYGAFALAYSLFLLLGVFHTAILTEPMLVFGPGKYAGRFREYLGILLRGHFALMLPSGLLLLAAAFLLGRLYSPAVERAFLGLALAGPFILLLWLVRRAFYVRLEPAWAAVGGGLYFLVLIVSIQALRAADALSPATGFLAMGAGALAASALLLAHLRPRLRAIAGNPTAPALVAADHWRYGRWALATAGVSWFPSNIYFVLLPAWFSLEAAGALKALLNLAMPALHSIGALSGLLLPALAANRKQSGSLAMAKTMRSFLVLFLFGAALYLAVLWGLGSELFRLFYAAKYTEYASWPLLLTGVLPLGGCVTAVLSNALRALERPGWVFWCYLGSSIVALLVGIPLILSIGVTGALLGQLFSSLTAGALMFWFYQRFLRQTAKLGA